MKFPGNNGSSWI